MTDPTDFYDDTTLTRELRAAMKTEEEINLFKTIRDNLQVKDELANSKSVQIILSGMWGEVADFFDFICTAETLCGLQPNDDIVIKHARMRANFDAVAAINNTFKEARDAEEQLTADDMDSEISEEPDL